MSDGLKPCPHRQVDDSGRILCGLIRSGDREVSVNLCRACPVPQINCQHLRASMQKQVSTPLTVRYATGRVEVWNDEAPTISFKRAACAEKTMPINTPRDCAGCPLRAPVVIPQSVVEVARRNKPAIQPTPQPFGQPSAQPAARAAAEPPIPVSAQAAMPSIARAAEQPMASVPAQPIARAPRRSAVKSEARARAQPELQAPPAPAVNPEMHAASASESAAAEELVRRAQALAADKYRKARRAAAATPQSVSPAPNQNKSKIILLQQWLADQFNKKNPEALPAANPPDEDGVQDIIYTPIAPVYNEEPGNERCVGWTD